MEVLIGANRLEEDLREVGYQVEVKFYVQEDPTYRFKAAITAREEGECGQSVAQDCDG